MLESGATIFTWTGTLASKTTAATRAIYLALQLKASRGVGGGLGAAPCNVVAQTQTQETAAFWSALDEAQEASGALPLSADEADPSVAFFPHILYKVLGGRVEICGKGDTLHRKALASTAGFVLDTLNAVFCWIGADCGDRDAAVASARADELSKKTGRPVVREIDGRESPFFQAQILGFDDDKILKEARKVAIGKIDVTKLSPRTLAALASPTRSPAAHQPRPHSLPTELSPDLLRRQFESEAASAATAAANANAAAQVAPTSSSSRGSLSPRAHSPRGHSPRRSRERQRTNPSAAGTVGGSGSKHRRRRSRGRHATLHHESRATNKTQLTAAAIVAAAAAEEAANADSRRTHRTKRSTTTPHGLAAAPPAGMSPLLTLNIPSGSPSNVAKTFAVLRSPRARMDDSEDDDDDNNNNMTTDNDNSAKDRDQGESDVAAGDVTLAGAARRSSISGGRKKLSVDTAAVPAAAAAAAAAAASSSNVLDKSLVSSPAPLTGRSDGDSSQIDAAVNLHTRDLREDIGTLRQQINQIESHITLIKLSGRQPSPAGSTAVAATAAAAPAHPTLPVPNGSVIVRGGTRVVGGAAPVPAEPTPAPTVLPASGATPPVVPPLPMAWFYVNLQGGEPFALLGEYRVRVAVAAEDGGDSVLYATRVDSSSLHFDQLGSVRAVNKGQFRWTQNNTNSVVVWIQCRDPNGQLVSNAQPSPRVLGKSASKGAGLTHGVVSQATNVFLSRSSSPTGSPRLQFVETGKSSSALSRSTTVAAAEVSATTSMASSTASIAPTESTPTTNTNVAE